MKLHGVGHTIGSTYLNLPCCFILAICVLFKLSLLVSFPTNLCVKLLLLETSAVAGTVYHLHSVEQLQGQWGHC